MKKNVRLFAFLLAIIMTFTLTGCGEFSANPSTAHPTGSVPTTSTAGNYTAEDISALITRLKTATSTTVGNYTAAMDLITGDFEARPEGTDSDEFRQMEADLVQTRDARLAALDAMIKVLEGLDPSATDAVAAKIAEAERMISEEHHVYGEKIPHSRNPEGTSCTEADHYQICTQCNAVIWTKGEHQWFYSRNMEDHQKCCRLCDATEPKAQHDTNDQGKCSVCNYKMNANILIIESIAGESEKLSGMIASNHSLTVVGISDSARMPASIDELKVYDEVILVNVANRDMPEGFAELLQTYVQDLGGGLLTVGGNTADSTQDNWKANAYDKTDLQGTIYQDMLPVEITETVASIGVMIIIDRSGSMWYQMDGQPYEESKFYAAKQGAAACVDMLQAGDYLGILSLGDIYDYTPELIPITQKDKILNEIDNINFGGGTIFEGALATARQALLANTQVQKRHIIMITDGEPADRNPEMYLEQARLNAEAGITMSVVGTDCLEPVKREMVKLVKAGGGEETHFYDVGADSDGGYDSGVANAMREAMRCDELRKVIYADYTPSVAVIILVDVSSSMWPGLADADYPYEQSKLYYAVAAAKASLDVLDANDYVGVMALADYYSTALELTPCSQRDKIINAISRLPEEGLGGTIFSAPLEAAGKALNAMTNVDKKHIILITDGEPYAADTEAYQYMLRQNAAAGITTSIIGIQCIPTAAANMKATLVAHAGMAEKNFYDVSDLQSTVKAMLDDLSTPAFKEVKYNPFQPTLHASSSITQGIAQADIPKLGGFYYSQLKDGATTIISKGSAPIYAHWNYGKGMVGSFMCDLNGTWSADFLNAEAGATIINNIISHLANERIPDDSASPVVGNQIGDLCPSVQLSVLTGDGVSARTIDPSKLGKITIIYFWGAWCGPCKAELPFFDEVASMFPDQVAVVAIHSIVSASDGSECITKNYPNSKIIFAVDNKCDKTDIPGIRGEFFLTLGFHDIYPATVILDENGMIIYSGCKNFHSVEDLLAELPNSLLEDTQANKQNPSTATVSTPGNNDIAGSFMCDLNGTWSADFIASEEGAEIINRIIFSLANPPEETE